MLVVSSAVLHANCTIVRGGVDTDAGSATEARPAGETFVIDSPVLPDELDALSAVVEQAQYPPPSGLLATHADWDHLLGRLAFPGVALGCAESTAERLRASPGEAQRQLRAFDADLLIERPRPLALGSIQGLPVPGRCEVGDLEIELHPAEGHTADGMALFIPWAGVLVAGDYLSPVELPTFSGEGAIQTYLRTLERLRPLVERSEYVVPGHGPVIDSKRALDVMEQDSSYLGRLVLHGAKAELPRGRSNAAHLKQHTGNAAGM